MLLQNKPKAILVLQDGTVFKGCSFGYQGDTQGEVVFNTSMMGYQEILTDPSYCGQIVTMTYPMIGNYGINSEDVESQKPQVAGFIVKEYSQVHSNFRADQTLADYLQKHQIVALEGIDTRALVRHIREAGAMPGLISTTDLDETRLKKQAKELPSMEGQNLAEQVTCKKPYHWKKKLHKLSAEAQPKTAAPKNKYKVIAYDFGIKQNILRNLVQSGCDVTVVPASTLPQEILAQKPDGLFLSNGPGDPAAVTTGIENVKQLVGKLPIFGICLGHQILGLARGAKTFKLKFGHRGGNQPVKDLRSGKVEITSQNHGFAISKDSFPKIGELTHVNLNDNTVAGFQDKRKKLLGVQYHPEASPGPHDSSYLFREFIEMMEANR